MKTAEFALIEDGNLPECYRASEDDHPHNLNRQSEFTSASEIREFLLDQMAVYLPRIGKIGRTISETATSIEILDRMPVQSEARQMTAQPRAANS